MGLYYILSHESTYCKPTPLFCADVRALAHRFIIRTLRYMHLSLVCVHPEIHVHVGISEPTVHISKPTVGVVNESPLPIVGGISEPSVCP